MNAELEHGEDCECVRCKGFQAGHALSTRHGAYSTLEVSDRAAVLAHEVRERMPVYEPADEFTVRALGVILARIERAEAAIAAAEENGRFADVQWLYQDQRRWWALALRHEEALGMPAASRAKLGLDLARTKRIDLSKLSDRELSELEALVERAEVADVDG